MKFTQPFFLLTLSIASALTLCAECARPSSSSSSSSSLDNRSVPEPAQGHHIVAASSAASKRHHPQQQRRQLFQKRGGLSSHPTVVASEAVAFDARAPTTSTTKSKRSSSSSATQKKRLDKSAVSGDSKIDGRSISSTSTTRDSQQKQQELRRRRNHKNSDDENRASAASATAETKAAQKRRRALSSTTNTPPPPPPSFRKRAAAAVDPPSTPRRNSPARSPLRHRPTSKATRKKNTPLLILPDSRSVWQTGTYQTVRWNRKYTKKLPADTTVDIVLIDSTTNRKVSSLKRFVPFRKGGSQVLVPTNIPEDTSFVLVLELYRGRSQEQVTSSTTAQDTAGAAGSSPYTHRESSDIPPAGSSSSSNGDRSASSSAQHQSTTTADVLSRIVRRSDINIAAGTKKRDLPQYPPGSSYPNSNNINNNNGRVSKPTGTHHDINHDDFYAGPSQERSMEFMPDELRQEYPNTVRPLILEHTFGLHQKVYTLTPYTLEWKIPERVAELLEYTRKAQELARAGALLPKSTFLSKVLVEIIKDQNMESVSVLAKDVPAETMFQYLSIQDRLPPAFYRLRVQMVVVQVHTDVNALLRSSASIPGITASPSLASKAAMEGWEFPEGGEVIDRYEAITRRFWVSQGAL
ncbi:hypothetical protein BGZ95_012105 [Linnemannia exigua]|uniref:Uncharacterized protein n=1 Tax=Linnemannia exigua TaxID=604196 RepID=A0AAD4D8X9_9FUNG|nr:hypothetical protein BGZ95_012105 [Linnemannia exigua]